MQAESILAKNISAAGRKSSYDTACKRLLANKIILAQIMKSCLVEYKDLEVLLSPIRKAAEKKQILQDDFHIEMT